MPEYPQIRFDSSVSFDAASTNTSPQAPVGTPSTSKTIPSIALAYSPTPTKTPTITPTPTVTKTVTPTSATKTPTPTPTLTPTNTATKTVTPTVTRTVTQTVSPTKTSSLTPTPTKSNTPTPTLTSTTTPTPTPTRECITGEIYSEYSLPASTTWNDITYNSGNYVIIESANSTLYGTDFTDLNVGSGLPLSGPEYWKSVIYFKDKFIAIGAAPSGAYSVNGDSWNLGSGLPTASGTSYTWNQVILLDNTNRLAAIPSTSNKAITSRIAFSTDGISWTSNNLPTLLDNVGAPINKNYLTLAYGNNTIVIGSDANNEYTNTTGYYVPSFLVSTNGGTVWTERKPIIASVDSNNYIGNIVKIVYGNGVFVAIARGSVSNSECYRIYYSNTGIDWSLAQTIVGPDADLAFGTTTVYGSGKFIFVIKDNGADYTAYHSLNGKWWYSTGSRFPISGGIRTIIDDINTNSFMILSTNKILSSNNCNNFGY